MPISSSDIVLRYSVTTGSAGDSVAGTAGGSLGKYISQTPAASGLNGLFDDVSGAENAASTVDYRCIFVLNNHATLTAGNVVAYLSAQVAGGTDVAIALDSIGASAKGSGSAQADQIASETTAPTSVGSFSSPTSEGSGLAIGPLAPGECKAIWIRRTASNTGPLPGDGFTLAIAFDSP